MFRGVYNDEDNAPLLDSVMEDVLIELACRNGRYMPPSKAPKAKEEPLPFTDPPNGCWNCMNYDWRHEACTTNWNNMDESYYVPEIDDRKPDDVCEYWELNEDAEWGDWHDT